MDASQIPDTSKKRKTAEEQKKNLAKENDDQLDDMMKNEENRKKFDEELKRKSEVSKERSDGGQESLSSTTNQSTFQHQTSGSLAPPQLIQMPTPSFLRAHPLIADPLIADPLVANPLVASPLIASPLVASPLVAAPLSTQITTPTVLYNGFAHAPGLVNFGVDCFSNQTVQAILHVKPFAELFNQTLIQKQGDDGLFDRVYTQLKNHVARGGPYSQQVHLDAIEKFCDVHVRNFNAQQISELEKCRRLGQAELFWTIVNKQEVPRGRTQEDCENFLVKLFEAFNRRTIQSGNNLVSLDEELNKLVGFTAVKKTYCERCNETHSMAPELGNKMLQVAMPISEVPIELNTLINTLHEDHEDYRCERCEIERNIHERKDVIMEKQIIKGPPILIVQFKRYFYDVVNDKPIKNQIEILNLQNLKLVTVDEKEGANYKLIGAIQHDSDDVRFGHYTSYSICQDGKTYNFNDRNVNEASMYDVDSKNVYLCIYQKTSDDETVGQQSQISNLPALSPAPMPYFQQQLNPYAQQYNWTSVGANPSPPQLPYFQSKPESIVPFSNRPNFNANTDPSQLPYFQPKSNFPFSNWQNVSEMTGPSSASNLRFQPTPTPTFPFSNWSNKSATKTTQQKENSKTANMTPNEEFVFNSQHYIGSHKNFITENTWIWDNDKNAIVQRPIHYNKSFVELFDGTIDFMLQTNKADPSMNTLNVSFNKNTNEITILVNGMCTPHIWHENDKTIIGPEIVFGKLKFPKQYNEEEKRVTGARSGLMPKICNAMSTKFEVIMTDRSKMLHYKQTWVNGMEKSGDAKIDENVGNADQDDFTCVKFQLNLAKFDMSQLNDNIIGLLTKKLHDISFENPTLNIQLNAKKLESNNFFNYTRHFKSSQNDTIPLEYTNANQKWQIAIGPSDSGFQHFSFVNFKPVKEEGPHTKFILNQIAYTLMKSGRTNGNFIDPDLLKQHLCLLINCKLDSATIDKGMLIKKLSTKDIGKNFTVAPLVTKFFKSPGILDTINEANATQQSMGSAEQSIEIDSRKAKLKDDWKKLDDAEFAGTQSKSQQCSLIVTEGDSAKTFVTSGYGPLDQNFYGVYPLQGKLLNVRRATEEKCLGDKQINALVQILGLDYGKTYALGSNDFATLRYGKLTVLHDQDEDGIQFLSAVANFLHKSWPNLLKDHQFVEFLVLPRISATKGSTNHWFYSIPEFNNWKMNTPKLEEYDIKQFNSPANLDRTDSLRYFKDIDAYKVPLIVANAEDENAIEKAFSKKGLEQRRLWLSAFMQKSPEERQGINITEFINNNTSMSFKQFVDNYLMAFGAEENHRTIPSLIDGLIPARRKILFTAITSELIQNNARKDFVTFGGEVRASTHYKHGGKSLYSGMTKMGQNFVGSCNVNYLIPRGQFGSREQNGKDCAQPHYLDVGLNQLVTMIFPSVDKTIQTQLYMNKSKIEPKTLMPIIPTVLLNGADGMGSTHTTSIPCFKLNDLIGNIENLIKNKPLAPMTPHYKGFNGKIVKVSDKHFGCYGALAIVDHQTIEITEIPIETSIQKYRENVLRPMLNTTPPQIVSFTEHHMGDNIKFIVKVEPGKALEMQRKVNLHEFFELQSVLYTTNMHLMDKNDQIRKYESAEEILLDFYHARLDIYNNRKKCLLDKYGSELDRLTQMENLMRLKLDGNLNTNNQKGDKLAKQLSDMSFAPDPIHIWKTRWHDKMKQEASNQQTIYEVPDSNNVVSSDQSALKTDEFGYLTNITEREIKESDIQKLQKEREAINQKCELLLNTDAKQLWIQDLDTLKKGIAKQEKEDQKLFERQMSYLSPDQRAKLLPNPNALRIDPRTRDLKQKYAKFNTTTSKQSSSNTGTTLSTARPTITETVPLMPIVTDSNAESNIEQTTHVVQNRVDPTRSLYVSHLNPNTTDEQSLDTFFAKYGKISRIDLPKKNNGRPKGFAFIEFERVKIPLNDICQLTDGTNIAEHIITVDLAGKERRDSNVQPPTIDPNNGYNNQRSVSHQPRGTWNQENRGRGNSRGGRGRGNQGRGNWKPRGGGNQGNWKSRGGGGNQGRGNWKLRGGGGNQGGGNWKPRGGGNQGGGRSYSNQGSTFSNNQQSYSRPKGNQFFDNDYNLSYQQRSESSNNQQHFPYQQFNLGQRQNQSGDNLTQRIRSKSPTIEQSRRRSRSKSPPKKDQNRRRSRSRTRSPSASKRRYNN